MKKRYALILGFFIAGSAVFADSPDTAPPSGAGPGPASEDPAAVQEIRDKPFVVFNEGVTAAWVTRIIKQEGRSNFVFTDFMPGLYLGIKSVNMQPLDSILRLAVYYPVVFTFNEVPQYPTNVLRFAIDFFGGIDFELNMWEYVRFNISPGLHVFFQNSDRWNYLDVGIAGLVGMELPVARKWTILINGLASFDYGNLGNNRDMEPYNFVYQYQIDLGVRYSKRDLNTYPYIKPKD